MNWKISQEPLLTEWCENIGEISHLNRDGLARKVGVFVTELKFVEFVELSSSTL